MAFESTPLDSALSSAGETAHKRVPDFFIVGHHKSGTTALYNMLRRHPQIYMPDLKEPRYFAEDMYAPDHRPRSGELPRSLEAYLALFADASPDQRAGEASPFYLASRVAAAEIAEVLWLDPDDTGTVELAPLTRDHILPLVLDRG